MIALNFCFPIYTLGPVSSCWQSAPHGCSSYLTVSAVGPLLKAPSAEPAEQKGEMGREVSGQARPKSARLLAGGNRQGKQLRHRLCA